MCARQLNIRNTTCRHSALLLAMTIVLSLAAGRFVEACPFCSTVSQTLSEELTTADVAVIAELVQSAAPFDLDDPAGFAPADVDTGKATFEIVETLHGESSLGEAKQLEVVYFGDETPDKKFLIIGVTGGGVAGDQLDWTSPLPLSSRAVDYVRRLSSLPKAGADRLEYFQKHLEDEDPLLGQDAYDEFAKAPYEAILAFGDRMDRESLIRWIDDPQVGPTHRRLYLTMLGVCGMPEDLQMLESLLRFDYQRIKPGLTAMMAAHGALGFPYGISLVDEMVRAEERRKKQCLDALVASYLKLKGPDGLELIEQLFLTNPHTEYTKLYSAIMALRFHGEEGGVISRDRLLKSVRLLLDNAEIADQIIPDLARWEDWSVLERLVEMFKVSEPNAWIRQPVVSYVLTAADQPGDVGTRAGEALAQLEQIDPEGVKRARSYMAFAFLGRANDAAGDSADGAAQSADNPTGLETPSEQAPAEQTGDAADAESDDSDAIIESTESESTRPRASEPEPPSNALIIGVPLLAALLLMGVFAVLLRGAGARIPEGGSSQPSEQP